MTRGDLFPSIEPYRSGLLAVDSGHNIYWEESGNPSGVPVLFLHGGPGSGATPMHRRFFDPYFYRIVIFDQRGAGRSTPAGSVENNTTAHLIGDIETLRQLLGIDAWLIFGGSWGSTLALAYGETHPERCRGFVLRGIFLCRPGEIDWFLYGIATLFPEVWRKFVEFLPVAERGDLLENYYRRLTDPDPAIHLPAAHAWSRYEGSCSTLLPSPDTVAVFGEDRLALGLARLEAHYMKHGIFMPENALLDGIDRVRGIPAFIIQGRYDAICPIVTADTLARAWPEAKYIIVPDAGHSAMEPGLRTQLLGAVERMKRMLR
ncbi:MAG: prolyl aminopeptidase [Aliidongia sp.]